MPLLEHFSHSYTIFDHFSVAAELVLVSMSKLPNEIPAHFNNTYTPIAAAGTQTQVQGGP